MCHHHFINEKTKTWQGWVNRPKLHAFINLGLPRVGLSCCSDPHLFLNYSHFSFFFQPGLIFFFLSLDRIVGYCKTKSLGTSLEV